MQYDIDGVFVAHDDDLEINAEVRVKNASVSIRAFGGGKERTIRATKPAAVDFVDLMAAELLGGAVVPHLRQRPPELVMCPKCLGGEPEMWDCETCRGGGKVLG